MSDIKEKEKNFLLDAPVSPSELLGMSVKAVMGKFREVKAQSACTWHESQQNMVRWYNLLLFQLPLLTGVAFL